MNELENSLSAKIDFNAIADKAEAVFADDLSGCRCGVMLDNGSEYVLLTAHMKKS